MNFEKEILQIGKIVNTFGKNGTVKLLIDDKYWINDEAEFENKVFFFKDQNNVFEPLQIKKAVISQDNLLMIDFDKYDSINKSEKLKNKTIYSIINDNLFLEEVDYSQYTIQFELNGKQVNLPVTQLMENGQYTLFKINLQDKEFWIPGVEEYIDNIDDEQKIIFAKNIERFI